MKAIDFVVRNNAGGLQRGTISADAATHTIQAQAGQEISLNIQQMDLQSQSRVGSDLVITLTDGRVITIDNYFNDTGAANRLFVSADGYLNEVSFVELAGGDLSAQYGPTEQWGKWSPSDDLIYLGRTEVAGVAAADEEVSMLGTALLGVGGLGGAGIAAGVVGGAAAISAIGGSEGAEETIVATDSDDAGNNDDEDEGDGEEGGDGGDEGGGGGDDDGDDGGEDGTPAPADPYVNDPESSTDIGGDDTSTHTLTVSGGGEPGDSVSITVGDQTQTTVINEDGEFSVDFVGDTFPEDGTHETVVVVTTGGGDVTLDGPGYVIDTIAPEVTVTQGTESVGDFFNADGYASGITIEGTGEAGATVAVTIQGISRTTTVSQTGTWSVTWQTGVLEAGEYTDTVSIVTTDSFGNSRSSTETLVVDTIATVTVETATVEIDGVINGVEQEDGSTITGTAQAGSSVEVTFGDVTHTVIAGADGSWSADFTAGEIPTGEYTSTVTAVATDTHGNTATASGQIDVDTSTHVAYTTSAGGADGVINDTEAGQSMVYTGTTEPGSTLQVTVEGVTRTATVDGSGNWSVAFAPGELPDGTYTTTMTATATDAAGNTATAQQDVVVDTEVENLGIAADIVGGDGIINMFENDGAVTLTGTTEVGSTSVIVAMAGSSVNATIAANGSWTATFPAGILGDGTYDQDVSVTATDRAGNTDTVNSSIRVDTEVVPFSQSGGAGGADGVLNAAEAAVGIDLGGQVEAGSTVIVNFDGTNHTAVVDAGGAWAVTIPASAITKGTYDAGITITATDGAGNIATLNDTLAIDTDAPDGPVVAAYTRDGDGFRGIATAPDLGSDGQPVDGITTEVAQVNPDGSVSDVITHQSFNAFRGETNIDFANNVPDGSDIVITDTDDAGNTSGTYLVLDDEAVAAEIDLSSPALGNLQIENVDMQFAEEAHLTIDEATIVALSTNSNTLTVHGGSDDKITIEGGTKTGTTQVEGNDYDVYSVGEATVIVDEDISVI